MRYISLFSGVECASLAWASLGWKPICFSEIDPFASAVLANRFPEVPNVGDMTRHDWTRYRGRCDVVVGGSPCQAFSVAGLRKSLSDARGNLALSYIGACNDINPAFCIWENVVGVASTKDNALGCFLAGLVGADEPLRSDDKRGRWPDAGLVVGPRRAAAWGVLDAQHFGVPQRRRRIFCVAVPLSHPAFAPGKVPNPAAVLFNWHGLSGHPAAGVPPGTEDRAAVGKSPSAGRRGKGRRNTAFNAGRLGGLFGGVPAEPSPDETVGPLLATSFLGGLSGKLDTAKAGHFIPASDGRQDAPSGEVVVATGKGGGRNIDVSPTLDTQGSQPDRNQMGVAIVDPSPPPEVVAAVTAKWAKGSGGPAGDETQNLVLAFHPTQDPISSADVSHALSCGSKSGQASVAVVTPDHAENGPPVAVARHVTEVVPTLRASDGTLRPDASADAVIVENLTARRLTPRECERLQGMPDDHTLVPFGRRRRPKDIEELAVYWGVPADIARTLAADCHRYKAVGNGMAVPVVWWIGRRIEWVLQQLAAWDGLFDDDFLPLGDRS